MWSSKTKITESKSISELDRTLSAQRLKQGARKKRRTNLVGLCNSTRLRRAFLRKESLGNPLEDL